MPGDVKFPTDSGGRRCPSVVVMAEIFLLVVDEWFGSMGEDVLGLTEEWVAPAAGCGRFSLEIDRFGAAVPSSSLPSISSLVGM